MSTDLRWEREMVRGGTAVLSVAAAAASIPAYHVSGVDGVLLVLLGAATLAVLLIPMYTREGFDAFEPISFVALAVAVGVTGKAIYLGLIPWSPHLEEVTRGENHVFFLRGAMAMALGTASLALGYSLRVPSFDPARVGLFQRVVWRRTRVRLAVGLYFALSALFIVLFVRKMGVTVLEFGDLSSKRWYEVEGAEFTRSALGYYRWGASLAGPAFFVLLAWRSLAPRQWTALDRFGLVVSGLVAVAFPAFTSSRGNALLVLLNGLLIYYYGKGRVKLRTALLILAGALVLFLSLTALRSVARDLDDVVETVSPAYLIEQTVGSRHFADLGKTAHIMGSVPYAVPFHLGETFTRWTTAPIPRTVWKEKPTLGSGPRLGREVYGMQGGGVPPGIIAELFLNFGWWGILPGMFVIGICFRVGFNSFLRARTNPNVILLYASLVVFASFGLMSGDFSRVVVTSAVSTITVAVTIRLVGERPLQRLADKGGRAPVLHT